MSLSSGATPKARLAFLARGAASMVRLLPSLAACGNMSVTVWRVANALPSRNDTASTVADCDWRLGDCEEVSRCHFSHSLIVPRSRDRCTDVLFLPETFHAAERFRLTLNLRFRDRLEEASS